jgi:hypothetical protein
MPAGSDSWMYRQLLRVINVASSTKRHVVAARPAEGPVLSGAATGVSASMGLGLDRCRIAQALAHQSADRIGVCLREAELYKPLLQ